MEIKHGNFAGSFLNFRDVNIIGGGWTWRREMTSKIGVGLVMTDPKPGYVRLVISEVCPAKRNKKIQRMTFKLTQENILCCLISICPVGFFCHSLCLMVFKVHSVHVISFESHSNPENGPSRF